MFGRIRCLLAFAAIVTYVSVNLVVVPWHHLTVHQFHSASSGAKQTAGKPRCHCCHHSHCRQSSLFEERSSRQPTNAPNVPHDDKACVPHSDNARVPRDNDARVPHDDDDCPICQVAEQPLAQPLAHVPLPAVEQIEPAAPESVVQLLLGSVIELDSRGPPVV